MKPGHKFLLGASVIVAAVTTLIATGVKETGVYFLTPSELAAKSAADPTFVENVGFKVGAKVVKGSIRRDDAARTVDFQVSDGVQTYPVTYRGLVPDTFTDANDIEVIVEGRLGRDGPGRAGGRGDPAGLRPGAAIKARSPGQRPCRQRTAVTKRRTCRGARRRPHRPASTMHAHLTARAAGQPSSAVVMALRGRADR